MRPLVLGLCHFTQSTVVGPAEFRSILGTALPPLTTGIRNVLEEVVQKQDLDGIAAE
jgi:hypothetical protein